MPTRAVPGDLLVLTKPLGTQVAVNLFQWLETDHPRWSIASEVIEKEDVKVWLGHRIVFFDVTQQARCLSCFLLAS